MSAKHPIIAITGSSGSGVTSVTQAIEHILWRVRARGVYIQGNAFHRYDRKTMEYELSRAQKEGRALSHFGPEGNMLEKLESLFAQYSETGTGQRRYYLQSKEHAQKFNQESGTFTPWTDIESGSDLMIYKGLHGAAIHDDMDLSQYPDLLIGMVPNTNLEWIRKISRDTSERGYSVEQVRESILHRLPDYVNHITPQFSRTHINFQMISAIDTSDPFDPARIPNEDDCFVIIHTQNGRDFGLKGLCDMIPDSFMSRPNNLVIPGGKRMMAIESIFTPIIEDLVSKGRELRGDSPHPDSYRGEIQGLI